MTLQGRLFEYTIFRNNWKIKIKIKNKKYGATWLEPDRTELNRTDGIYLKRKGLDKDVNGSINGLVLIHCESNTGGENMDVLSSGNGEI